MGVTNLINNILKQGIVSEQVALYAIAEQIGSIQMQDYYYLVAVCKSSGIDANSFFRSLYLNAPEQIQYQMWKDGYVESCPAKLLIADIAFEKEDTIKLIKDDYGEDLTHCEAYFNNIQDVVIKHLLKAKSSIKVAMAWFTNPAIFDTLLRICKRGIDLDLFINNDLINNRPNGLPFNKLIQAGANLYIAEPPALIHNKFCIIDDKIVIDGSYNWTILAEKNNDENIVVIENGSAIDAFIEAFNKLIQQYDSIDCMPDRVPERFEYDCCSFKYYNSEEWLEQVDVIGRKKKRYELYKEIYKILPEEIAKEKLPKEVFELIKNEIEKEREQDDNLFKYSITKKVTELGKALADNEKERGSVSQKVEYIANQKRTAIEKYKAKIENIKSKKVAWEQKKNQIGTLRRTHKIELNRLNKSLAKYNDTLTTLQTDSDTLSVQYSFIQSIQDSNLEGSNGLFRINLKWDTTDDLDLHLVLPGGYIDSNKDIYYGHMRSEYNGGVCSLDHDAIPNNEGENPQENIVWEQRLPDGQYRVMVKLYNKKSGLIRIPFSITTFARKYVKTEVYCFNNAEKGNVIEIATITFKNGKVITPIVFNKN